MWKRFIAIAALWLVGTMLVCYLLDYAVLEIKIHNGRNAFGSMMVRRYYAVPLKNGKIEFLSADPIDQTCVHSLFPHLGDPPCWYLVRHPEQRIDM